MESAAWVQETGFRHFARAVGADTKAFRYPPNTKDLGSVPVVWRAGRDAELERIGPRIAQLTAADGLTVVLGCCVKSGSGAGNGQAGNGEVMGR